VRSCSNGPNEGGKPSKGDGVMPNPRLAKDTIRLIGAFVMWTLSRVFIK